MSEKVYKAQFFINKFDAIPDEKWCMGKTVNDEGQHCAIGHAKPDEIYSIFMLFRNLGETPMNINDGKVEAYQQETPRERIVAALKDIQEKGF